MSREHLYKAKRVNWRELPKEEWWVEGALFEGKENSYIFTNVKVTDKWENSEIGADVIGYLVDPETVCEYTGLTDKNGRNIFEGYIVKTSQYGVDDGSGHNCAGFDTFSIEFSDGGFCLKNKWRRFNLRPLGNFEVIGNIFDNPELLE